MKRVFLKRNARQSVADEFSLKQRIIKKKTMSALQKRLLAMASSSSSTNDSGEEEVFEVDMKEVEEKYLLQNIYFEIESKSGSVVMSNRLEPEGVYFVHGDKVVSETEHATNESQVEKRTGLVYDPRMLSHFGRASHPESPARLTEIWRAIEEEGFDQKCKVIEGTVVSDSDLSLVHTQQYIEGVKYQASRDYDPQNTEKTGFPMTSDVFYNENTAQAALCAVGSVVDLTERVCNNTDGIHNGFAIVRPPGHHAYSEKASGFCIFNNVAVAARTARQRLGVQKVLVLDWDVHHGNGTQDILQEDEDTLFISIHRYGNYFYPNTGGIDQVGKGKGIGKTVNIGFSEGAYGDGDALFVFNHIILPIAYEFNPDLVLVSAGFDAVESDPLGEMKLTPQVFGHLTSLLMTLANGKIVLALEGGYKCDSLAHCVVECLQVLTGQAPSSLPGSYGTISNNTPLPTSIHLPMYKKVIEIQSEYWQSMKSLHSLFSHPQTAAE